MGIQPLPPSRDKREREREREREWMNERENSACQSKMIEDEVVASISIGSLCNLPIKYKTYHFNVNFPDS
jgi:hypothetical protein